MRLKNKKHKHFSRTDNKKYQEQNHKKEKTNNNNTIIVAIFIAFASTIQFSHNTPPQQTTPNHMRPKTNGPQPAKGPAYLRGDSIEQQPCCSRHPTACHTTKQTKTQTRLLPCKTLMANWPKKPYFVSLIPLHAHTTHAHTRGVSHLKTKTATTRCSPAPRNNGKTRHPARRLTRHPTQ